MGAARSQAGGGLRGGRGAGRGGAAKEAHGGIARHRAGQLRSARLRCRLRSRHGSQPPPGAKPKPQPAGGEEGGGALWGRGLGQAGGATGGAGPLGVGPLVVGGPRRMGSLGLPGCRGTQANKTLPDVSGLETWKHGRVGV